MHLYRITYHSFNRTTQRMHRHLATASGTSRWSALRAWWAIERQWQNPVVQVLSVDLDHRNCHQRVYPHYWEYACTP